MNNRNTDKIFSLTNIGVWVLIAGILVMSVYFFLANDQEIAKQMMTFIWISLGVSGVGIVLIVIGRIKDKHQDKGGTKHGLYIDETEDQKKK